MISMRVCTIIALGIALAGCVANTSQTRDASWVVRPQLGVRLRVVPAAELPEGSASGSQQVLRVQQVRPGLPADVAGAKVGDILLRMDGKAVMGMQDSVAIMEGKRPGDRVTLTILRDTELRELTVNLGGGGSSSGSAVGEAAATDF